MLQYQHSGIVITVMSFTGTVENGVVKLPADAALPNGTKVRVEPITKSTPANSPQRFPTVKVNGGPISSQQVAEALDDE